MLASPPACSVCLCITRMFLPEPGFGHRHVPALWHVLAGGERKDVAMFCAPLPVSGFGAFLKKTRESDILQRSSLWNLGLFWPLGQNLFLKMVFLIETFFFSFKLFFSCLLVLGFRWHHGLLPLVGLEALLGWPGFHWCCRRGCTAVLRGGLALRTSAGKARPRLHVPFIYLLIYLSIYLFILKHSELNTSSGILKNGINCTTA